MNSMRIQIKFVLYFIIWFNYAICLFSATAAAAAAVVAYFH